jgi:aldehyde dehydrogenase (NAD+)
VSSTAVQSSQTVVADMQRIFALQQAQQWVTKSTSAEQRKEKLRKLKSAVEAHSGEVVAAVKLDTRKPEGEIRITELLNVIANIERNINNLDDWMKPVEVTPSQSGNDKPTRGGGRCWKLLHRQAHGSVPGYGPSGGQDRQGGIRGK